MLVTDNYLFNMHLNFYFRLQDWANDHAMKMEIKIESKDDKSAVPTKADKDCNNFDNSIINDAKNHKNGIVLNTYKGIIQNETKLGKINEGMTQDDIDVTKTSEKTALDLNDFGKINEVISRGTNSFGRTNEGMSYNFND